MVVVRLPGDVISWCPTTFPGHYDGIFHQLKQPGQQAGKGKNHQVYPRKGRFELLPSICTKLHQSDAPGRGQTKRPQEGVDNPQETRSRSMLSHAAIIQQSNERRPINPLTGHPSLGGASVFQGLVISSSSSRFFSTSTNTRSSCSLMISS